ncbi:MAG: hypothetical protein A2X86_02895 [Bdellovibrionales bacterium GWA2_49_15]|nr:MAG: hypothetical protein A2X86_02895 [Bdellovibrionales bacterium GWA2_49_15]HAZ14113.1 hypothetical protein [Bdellovibrionales bacterium]
MGKVLLLFFCLSAVSFGAENVLLIAGGYEGSDRNFIFNNIAHALARTLSARGWEASAIYGEPGHADQHRREFAADGPVNHVPFSLESLRARIQELVRGEGPAQLLLHLGGHGTIENGRYRIQIGADTYLNASELAELLRPLLAKGVKVAMTLDSCSSGQLIENLADSLGALTRNLCTVASTNRQPYVSSRGILGPMMGLLSETLPEQLISLEQLFRRVRQSVHFVRPRENLFPQISSFPAGISLGSAFPRQSRSPEIPVQCTSGLKNNSLTLPSMDIVSQQLQITWANVKRSCIRDVREAGGIMSYRGQYADQCRDSLPETSFGNNIAINPATYPGLFEWREGRMSGARSGAFEQHVRFFPDFDSASNILHISPAGICLSLLDDRITLTSRERQGLRNLIGEKFFQHCRKDLERGCCHYNFQKFVDLERSVYETLFATTPPAESSCESFNL